MQKISFGTLDACARMLDDLAPEFAQLWNEGEARMRPDDIKRVAAYLGRIRISSSRLRDTLKLFEALAKQPGAAVIISSISRNEKNLQDAAAAL